MEIGVDPACYQNKQECLQDSDCGRVQWRPSGIGP